jgi:hypothetical protein
MEAKSEGKEEERAEGKEEKGGAAESKSGAAEGDFELLQVVATYFKDQAFGAGKDEGLEVVYEDFICLHSETFYGADEEDADGGGHKIEFTELHQEYLMLFEKTCEWVIEVNQGSPEKFAKECEQAVKGGMPDFLKDDESFSWFVDALMAALDYKVPHLSPFLKRHT